MFTIKDQEGGRTMARHHHSHHHSHSHAYVIERVIAVPCKTNIPTLFSIAKRLTKHGKMFENLVATFQNMSTLETHTQEFDEKYTLLVENEADAEQIIRFALRIFPMLEQHLPMIKKLPVGQTMYPCILSFTKDICYIRFHPHTADIKPYYDLANELVSFSY